MRGPGAVPILRVAGVLLVSIQVDLSDTVAEALQEDILAAIGRTGSPGLVVDVTALETVDSFVARALVDTARMARLMGTETVIVGLRPEVAATLVRMGFDVSDIRAALDIDEGLTALGCTITRRGGARRGSRGR